jgi:hypothetical protein
MTNPEPEREMPDRDDRLLDLDDDVDAYEDDWEPTPQERALPPRPRRRLVTPASAALTAVLIAAAGFIGGVEVQKGQADSSSATGGTGGGRAALAAGATAGAAGGAAGARGGFPGRGGGAQGNATIGSVANKHGSTLYVKDSDGNTVRVKTTSHSKINRTATASAGAIHPGDTVIVQGTKSANGTITATQINATSSSAAGGLAGLFGGGGGFRGGGAGGGGGAQGAPAQPPGG